MVSGSNIARKLQMRLRFGVASGICLAFAATASATTYSGNGANGFGGYVGNGSLAVSDDGGGNITFTLNPASNFGNAFVLYLSTGTTGLSNTSTLTDDGNPPKNRDGGRETISGYNDGGTDGSNNNGLNGPSRSLVTFPTGFQATYALSFESTYVGLFKLPTDGTGTLTAETGASQSGSASSPLTVTFPLSDLGLSQGQGLELDGSLISQSAYRSNETIGGPSNLDPTGTASPGNPGFNGGLTYTGFDTYITTAATPEPTSLGLLGTALLGAFGFRRSRHVASV